MAISTFPAPSSETVTYGYAGAQAGTFALTTPLAVGTYLIETDASQTYTIGLANSTYNFKFTGTVRGGSGMVIAAYAVDQIVFPAGITFPVAVKITTISQPKIGAITSPAWSWDTPKTTGDFTCSAFPAGATGLGIWLNNGTFYSTASTSTSQANIAIAAPPLENSGGAPMLVAAKGSDGNYGTSVLFTSGAVPSSTLIQTYTSSGTFLSPFTGNAEILVVAGGGAGGGAAYAISGGGGGAGGYRTTTTQSVSAGATYAITIGSGGPGGASGYTRGSQGGSSSFGSYSATGGGGGGAGSTVGGSGGSGGGGGGSGSSGYPGSVGGSGNAGGYSPVEGYAGGNGQTDNTNGGGGGGAGGAGQTGPSGGNGGTGGTSSISGTSTTYAEGGNGSNIGSNKTTYGSGGKGSGYGGSTTAQPGLAGIVIVKYTF